MITLGIQLKGPELGGSKIERALLITAQTAARVRDARFKSLNEGWINPIYLVPGTVSKPDFEGYDLGHFSKKERGLAIAIAVPQSVADGEGVGEFIGTSLRETVRMAAAYFASKEISFSTLKAEKIILSIEAELRQLAA